MTYWTHEAFQKSTENWKREMGKMLCSGDEPVDLVATETLGTHG